MNSLTERMQGISLPRVILATILFSSAILSNAHYHIDDEEDYDGRDYKSQLLDHEGANSARGEKHIDMHESETASDHMGQNLDHKGKDKSQTATQAQLVATLTATDKHVDDYEHLHDNAHETEELQDHDHVRGDEAEVGYENGRFTEVGGHDHFDDFAGHHENQWHEPGYGYDRLIGHHGHGDDHIDPLDDNMLMGGPGFGYGDHHEMDLGDEGFDVFDGHSNMDPYGHGHERYPVGHGRHGGDVPWIAGGYH